MQFRQKLTEFESTMAFVIGGGMALIMLAFILAAAQGANPDSSRLDIMLIVGGGLFAVGGVTWAVVNRPWKVRDNWSKPQYTGHEHEEHHEEHPEPVEHVEHPAQVETHPMVRPVTALAVTPVVAEAPPIVVEAPESSEEEMAEAAAHREAVEEAARAEITPPVVEPPAQQPVVVAETPTKKSTQEMAAHFGAVEEAVHAVVEPPAEQPVVAAEAPAASVETPAPAAGGEDDLTQLEGIGPKSAAALKAAGIDTFAKLAALTPVELEKAIKGAGVRLVAKTDSWPRQAKLAAEGKFDELEKFQKALTAGREKSGD